MTRHTGFSIVVKALIRERADDRCEVCGEYTSDLQYHHRRARGMGSTRRPETNMPANCLLACAMDHLRIESHRSLSYDMGWLVHQGVSPAEVPVMRRGELVLLDDAGGVNPVEMQPDTTTISADKGVESNEAARCANTVRPLTDPICITTDRSS